MDAHLHEVRNELKRAEHLLYVSLKYTRTVDVIKSVVERLVNSIDHIIEALLEHLKNKKRIKEIPANVSGKCEALKKCFNDERLNDFINFYIMLRKILKAKYKRSCEYRKHVTMTAFVDNGMIEVNLEVIKQYYEKTFAFLDLAEELMGIKKNI